MPTFEMRSGKVSARGDFRSPQMFNLKQARGRFLLGNPQTGTEVASYEEYEKLLAAGHNIYLVPAAPQPPPSAVPMGTPTLVRVATWTPRLLSLNPSLETRLLLVEEAVYRAAGPRSRTVRAPAETVPVLFAEVQVPARTMIDLRAPWRPEIDLFLGVEYLFNLRAGTDQSKVVVPSSIAERDLIVRRMARLSQRTPGIVLIPGTIIWQAPSGVCHNSCFVFYDGELVESLDRRVRYDKCTVADYERRILDHLEWHAGELPWFFFRHPRLDLLCLLQICADHDCTPKGDEADLQLVCSTSFGRGGRPDTHRGGWCIYADGDGVWRRVRARDRASETDRTAHIRHDITLYKS